MNITETSKFLALILRHKPESIGITLDEHGWANVETLVARIAQIKQGFTKEILDEIVRTDNKERYSYNGDETKIRANQGHSIQVDVELEKKDPPEILWHGTGEKSVESIDEQGLIPKSRLYVHLASDEEPATKVGSRHGKPVIYKVYSGQMVEAGYEFFLSVNGVWLTKKVPVKYLERLRLIDA